MYVSRVKWNNQGKGVAPSLYFGVVAIEKGAFGSASTMVANLWVYMEKLFIEKRK